MDVKILLLINCVTVVYCQYTNSGREAAEWQNEYYEDVKSEIESIRQLLINQKKDDDVCNDRQAMQEMKSEIKDIRRIVSDQNQVLETLRDNWHEIAICPRGFTYLPLAGSCYKVVYESHNWTSAGKKCRELGRGTHLVAITSAAENNALKTFLETELSSMKQVLDTKIRKCKQHDLHTGCSACAWESVLDKRPASERNQLSDTFRMETVM